MFERFTDRARCTMQLANQEAQRFNHEYVGTEHILLGIVKEASGVAAHVLKNLDIDLRKIRLEVEKIVHSGPEMLTMGKLPYTPRAKRVLEFAIEEAAALGHNYVGTEHLLLGLTREEEGVASDVLKAMGLSTAQVREGVLEILGLPYAQSHPAPKAEEPFVLTLQDKIQILIRRAGESLVKELAKIGVVDAKVAVKVERPRE